jgi:hypothetical protein
MKNKKIKEKQNTCPHMRIKLQSTKIDSIFGKVLVTFVMFSFEINQLPMK